MRLLYMGTPASSASCLRRLARESWPLVGVVTQPDRPKGRSRALQPPPVKEAALEIGLKVYQPGKASAPEFLDGVRALGPDVIVVFAYGEILSEAFLSVPRLSTVNLHLSLLPKYRGAAPVQWAIADGAPTTGATVIHLVKKMDAGDVILQRPEPIRADDTGETLEARLRVLGAELLIEALGGLDRGDAPRTPQDEAEATFAPKLTKEHGLVDWTMPAEEIERRVRAFIPWPVAHTGLPDGGLLRILEAHAIEGAGAPGRVTGGRRALMVGTGRGLLELARVQPEGKRPMTAAEFLAGRRLDEGAALGVPRGGG